MKTNLKYGIVLNIVCLVKQMNKQNRFEMLQNVAINHISSCLHLHLNKFQLIERKASIKSKRTIFIATERVMLSGTHTKFIERGFNLPAYATVINADN